MTFNKRIHWINDDGVNLPMLEDAVRNGFYERLFKANVTGRHCVEIGFGTGLLSFLALKYQPKHITAFEKDLDRYNLGLFMIEQMNCGDQISLYHQQFDPACVDKDHDLVFHEILGCMLWNEGAYQQLNIDVPVLPSTYTTNILAIEITKELAKELVVDTTLVSKKDKLFSIFYQDIKDASWPDCTTIKEFDQVPAHIKQECVEMFGFQRNDYVFNPGVEISSAYTNSVESLLSEFYSTEKNKKIYKCGEPIRISPYRSLNNTTIASVVVDQQRRQIRVQGKISPWDFDKNYIDICLDRQLFKNKTLLLLPLHAIGHQEQTLWLADCCWGDIAYQSRIVDNLDKDLHVRQYFDSGKIHYWTD